MFDVDILKPVFTDIFCRRPIEVIHSGSAPITVECGGNTNFAISGKYLEGDVSIHSDNSRLSFQDIQQAGEFENTQVTSVVNCVDGTTESNIPVYGYTHGQEGNQTAKYTIDSAINIVDSQPTITKVEAWTASYTNIESTRFRITASADVTHIQLIAGSDVRTYVGTEFVYTFPRWGDWNVSIRGWNAEGEWTNTVSHLLHVPKRPFVNYCQVSARWAEYQPYGGVVLAPFELLATGMFVPSLWNAGQSVPLYQLSLGRNNVGWQTAKLRMDYSFNRGDLAIDVTKKRFWMNGSTNYHGANCWADGQNNNILYMDVTPKIPSYGAYDRVHIITYPVSAYDCVGASHEFAIQIYTYDQFVYQSTVNGQINPQAYPSTSLGWYSGSPSMQSVYGEIVGLDTYASYTGSNAGMLTSLI